MTVYKLVALPTPETLEQFSRWFASAPFTLEYDAFHVVLGTSTSPIEPYPEGAYRAVGGSLDWWFDTSTARSHLMLPLIPEAKMVARHDEVGSVWDMVFVPYMVLNSTSINNKHHTKAFINSIATMLIDTAPVLRFHNELCIPTQDTEPEHWQFYQDYISRGRVSNQLLAEEDEGLE